MFVGVFGNVYINGVILLYKWCCNGNIKCFVEVIVVFGDCSGNDFVNVLNY